ncbi:MAG: FecR domain-containing protein [Bacteroidetes bacterium]|nr:FecR domain-containing protein [Bacteroidota bacterium]
MTANNQHINDIDELIIRVLQASASPEDVESLRWWISLDPENESYFDQSRNMWMAAKHDQSEDSYDADKAWTRLSTELEFQSDAENNNRKEKKHLYLSFWHVAAVILVAFGFGIATMLMMWRNSITKSQAVYTQHIVPYGSKSQIILPDGSKVWLNAGSSIKYSQDFNHHTREVILDGEGYFDVASNEKLPFWVKTYGVNIKVVGTAFNVKAYREEKNIVTTVERGQIRIYDVNRKELEEKEIVIEKKQQGTFLINNNKLPKTETTIAEAKTEVSDVKVIYNVPTELFTSWKDKRWIIEREELGSLAVKIERRYDVSITFSSEALKHYIFSGIIEDESLMQVLKIISLTAPITYKLDKKKLILNENKSLLEYPSK